jgi:signal peptidase II
LLAALLALMTDQVSKLWVLRSLGPEPYGRRFPVAGTWFDLVYVRNTGVAFGMFQDFPQFFTFTALLICVGAVYAYIVYLPNRSTWIQISLGLVLGGGLGNILDRLRLGFVVDFVRVGWWPVFNVADSAICVGMTTMAVFLLLYEREGPPRRTSAVDDTLLQSLLSQDSWGDEEREGGR